jgi:adenylate cyclase
MDELINWILEEGRTGDDLGAIVSGLSERLVARGIPLCRVSVSMPTIDPTAALLRFLWSRDKGLASHALSPEDTYGASFRRSPIFDLLKRGLDRARWNLEDPDVVRRFEVFEELRASGMTEYAVRFVLFSEGRTALRGTVLSMVTDRPGGFTDGDFEAVDRIVPALSIVAYRIGLSHVATEILGAYLGPQTGANVLRGMIRRGDSRSISAALLLADLRGFTALVDRMPGKEVVGWLNQHLECVGDAVAERGGEVLKFLGDGLLAVFAADRIGADRACSEAVSAAVDACNRNAALSARRTAEGGPALDINIALHFGEVIYGNIGTARRLDFTVVGPAVNEVSRMEALGKVLGREVLLSQSIARRCGHPVVSLGSYELRGTTGMREMFALAP